MVGLHYRAGMPVPELLVHIFEFLLNLIVPGTKTSHYKPFYLGRNVNMFKKRLRQHLTCQWILLIFLV